MKTNVEIKARVRDPEAFAAVARALSGTDPEVLEQVDVFYPSARGRLKLRTQADGRAELIFYERPDRGGPKTSRYVLAPTGCPEALDAALGGALGRGVRVAKTRRLYLVGRTRIHLDDVEGLGRFMELEVVLHEGEDPAAGDAVAAELMAKLGVRDDDLVEGAYADLLGTEGS